ncbi:hypothetical protein M5X06_01510 [Paenibacillus alvei]|uniref:Uncharacterized protein n=2 Tax=Paenibacillus alvei TaxID=44250 RepID=A0ABT4H4Z1_PAEAL|nr:MULTISPECIES: STM3941 family protein [Paenibacillus]MCY9764055.1 hypothetical protein [Paenibacillus alvei]MCY9765513.1 hypothetical protein [Paenibacillus alvei]
MNNSDVKGSVRMMGKYEPESQDIVIYPSKRKLILLCLCSLIFIAIGAVLLGTDKGIYVILGAISIAFFGLGCLYSMYRMLIPKPAVILTVEGFYDQASLGAAGKVFWSEVEEIKIYEMMGQTFLGVRVVNPDQFLARCPGWKRSAMSANQAFVDTQINIPKIGIRGSIEQLAQDMHVRWEQEKLNQH